MGGEGRLGGSKWEWEVWLGLERDERREKREKRGEKGMDPMVPCVDHITPINKKTKTIKCPHHSIIWVEVRQMGSTFFVRLPN